MKKLFVTIAASALLATSGFAVADSANWDADKAAAVYQNRMSNSGKGNGGEKYVDGVIVDKALETGTGNNPDVDPGASGAQCQGGKNNKKNGDAC